MTDKERLDFIEEWIRRGWCPAVVFDDDGHFAVSWSCISPAPRGEGEGFEEAVVITVLVEPETWKPTIREAIDYAIEQKWKQET